MAVGILGLASCYATFVRLERIHGELFRMGLQVRTKADLKSHFGSPSEQKFYEYRGQKIECWIYKITLFDPHVFVQFEMRGDSIFAATQLNPSLVE